jgi:CheY-like chemotaxis protein
MTPRAVPLSTFLLRTLSPTRAPPPRLALRFPSGRSRACARAWFARRSFVARARVAARGATVLFGMGAKILIVDDDDDIRDGIVLALVDEGYHVDAATDGADALAKLEAGAAPDAIVLDLTMPVMDGYAFRERQLARATLASIPVICCSADGRAVLPGPAVWPLRKPFDLEQLLSTIVRVLEDPSSCGQPSGFRGSSTMKVAPSPGALDTRMVPPDASTICRTIHSPRPKPP